MTYPFGVWVKKPDSTYLKGAWHLKPDSGNATCVEFKKPVQQGDAFDIEFGRLKVVTGAPEYVGQYYVYLKVNGKLITSSYTAVDENGGYPDVRWNIVTMHHSLYCTANSAETCIPLREAMAPIFSELDIDVVLSAHDHAYVRTYMMDGLTPVIPDGVAVPSGVTDPDEGQVLYISFNSSSGSLYCGHVSGDFPFVAYRNQERVPNISSVSVTDTSFTVTTYRTTDMSVVDQFTINKSE